MKIEPNKFYRTRSGGKARIYATDGCEEYPIHGAVLLTQGWRLAMWDDNGCTYHNSLLPATIDLIAEWQDTPIVDWSAMPAWCNYVAMNKDGGWYAHAIEPTITARFWESDGLQVFIPKEYHPIFTGNWKDSLTKRP